MIKFSIIIPAYNAEKYIEQTLESIYNQTYENFEIIVIDDCSVDKTYQILQKHENIKLFKTEVNSRQGTARNIGLDNCKGDYVLFLDSDDTFFDENVLENLKNKINEDNHPDIVYTGIKIIGNRELEIVPDEENTEKGLRLGNYRWINVTTLCIKNEIIQKNYIRFPEKILYEDVYFAFYVIERARTFAYLDKITYLYNHRKNSTTTMYSFKQATDTVLLIEKLIELKDKIDEENIPFLKLRIEEQTKNLIDRINRTIKVKMSEWLFKVRNIKNNDIL